MGKPPFGFWVSKPPPNMAQTIRFKAMALLLLSRGGPKPVDLGYSQDAYLRHPLGCFPFSHVFGQGCPLQLSDQIIGCPLFPFWSSEVEWFRPAAAVLGPKICWMCIPEVPEQGLMRSLPRIARNGLSKAGTPPQKAVVVSQLFKNNRKTNSITNKKKTRTRIHSVAHGWLATFDLVSKRFPMEQTYKRDLGCKRVSSTPQQDHVTYSHCKDVVYPVLP